MSGQIENILTRYEEDINLHDCQQWERQLSEDPTFSIINDVDKRKTRRKMELLDVDLVRGSTFPKSKQVYDFKSILVFSLMSIVFFPFRGTWWIRKTSYCCYILGCLVFISSLLNLYWLQFYLCQENLPSCEKVTIHEVYEPIALFIVLAFLQCQIVSPLKFKNLDFFDQQPMVQGNEKRTKRNSFQVQRKSSATDKKTLPKSCSRSHTPRRKLSVRPCRDILDSWHEHTTSGSDNEESSTTLGPSDSGAQRETPSSEDRESELELGPCQTKRKLSTKQTSNEKDSEMMSSSTEDRNTKQSPIILKIGTTQWNENEAPLKIYMSALQIGNRVFERSHAIPDSLEYALFGIVCSIFIALLPLIFKFKEVEELTSDLVHHSFEFNIESFIRSEKLNQTHLCQENEVTFESLVYFSIIITSAVNRLILTVTFFVLLSVAERAFKKRYVTAKLFSHITSTRKSMKSKIPHFRLYKVRNIKAWLCVRAFLRKRGPQRSIDYIVSSAFILTLANVTWLCYQLLREDEAGQEINVTNCEVIFWCVSIGFFLVRYMTLASKTNTKYRNLSVLLTEQINLYLQMELKPHKKEQLQLASNVLKLSSDLLKELETPFKIHGLSANPFLYNVTRVLVLSAVSGVMSEMLGFKLKLYKVKLK